MSATTSSPSVPVTVFSGFVGAGKTTVILSLVKRLPKDYKVCVLKNEFGDAETDSELARESNLDIQEMINGCICCVLVGQMKTALLEIKEKYHPDRIIIETSGSAFPAPIAWQIRQMEPDGFALDAIITVVDCENFAGYEDTSYTARMQAQYTDVILLNKHEHVSEAKLDEVLDRVNDLNTDTVKVRCEEKAGVHPDLVFGLDTKLFQLSGSAPPDDAGCCCSTISSPPSGDDDGRRAECTRHIRRDGLIDERHHDRELDLVKIHRRLSPPGRSLATVGEFEAFLAALPKEDVYRVKGLARLEPGAGGTPALYIVNWAFGRTSLVPVTRTVEDEERKSLQYRITVMGVDLLVHKDRIVRGLCLDAAEVSLHLRRAA